MVYLTHTVERECYLIQHPAAKQNHRVTSPLLHGMTKQLNAKRREQVLHVKMPTKEQTQTHKEAKIFGLFGKLLKRAALEAERDLI